MCQPSTALAAEESIECRQVRQHALEHAVLPLLACSNTCRCCAGFGWSNGVMLSLLDRYGWMGSD